MMELRMGVYSVKWLSQKRLHHHGLLGSSYAAGRSRLIIHVGDHSHLVGLQYDKSDRHGLHRTYPVMEFRGSGIHEVKR